jgi:hypothetical protein
LKIYIIKKIQKVEKEKWYEVCDASLTRKGESLKIKQ